MSNYSQWFNNPNFNFQDPNQLYKLLSYIVQDIQNMGGGGSGDVNRVGSTTDNNLVLWNGNDADEIKDAGVSLGSTGTRVPVTASTLVANQIVMTEAITGGAFNGVVGLKSEQRSVPLTYLAYISQSGTDAPTVEYLVTNDLGGTPVFSYVSDGAYRLTINGAFTNQKIYPLSGDPDTTITFATPVFQSGQLLYSVYLSRNGADAIDIFVRDATGTVVDSALLFYPLLIQIYPS